MNVASFDLFTQTFARIWAAKEYVDPTRIGIWGWVCAIDPTLAEPRTDLTDHQSYGGFMASKIAEAGAGVHSLAMAVAVSYYMLSALASN